MKVWIFQTGEPLQSDCGAVRGMRAINLSSSLVEMGHDVTIWSSAFYHQEKRHRCKKFKSIDVSERLKINLIPSPGYRRNIGFGRLYDHAVMAKNLSKRLALEKDLPDIVVVGFPPIEFAYVAVKWASFNKIPSVLDVKDQWPDVFVDALPKYLVGIGKVVFFPYFYISRVTFKSATAFTTMSQSFMEWMCRVSGRPMQNNDFISPLSPIDSNVDDLSFTNALKWWSDRRVAATDRMRVFFVGSISQAFNFEPIIEAAKLSNINNDNWEFVICGDGELMSEIADRCSAYKNLIFAGWVDRPKVEALASICQIGIAPYKNTNNFVDNIPNKIIDYLSLGIPIASSLNGEVQNLITKYQVGFVYCDNETAGFYRALKNYFADANAVASASNNASNLYANKYSGKIVYANFERNLELISRYSVKKLGE